MEMMRKMLSVLLTLSLALALAIPAWADYSDASLGVIGGADGPTSIMISTGSEPMSEEERAQVLTLLGGKPGQINILLGDHCISFPDAVPEGRDGRTMVPLRACLEAMGAEVAYDRATQSAVVTGEDVSFTHVIGTDTIALANGESVQMDVASYAENGRTMVPVRFFSQVLGYDVFWDGGYQMVLLLDGEAIAAALDENFTIYNDFLKKSGSAAQLLGTYKEELTLSGTVALPDAAGGSQSYDYAAAMDALVSPEGVKVEMTGDFADLLALYEGMSGEAVPAALRELELEVLYGEKLYVRGPLLDALAAQNGLSGSGIWYGLDLGVNYQTLLQSLYTDVDSLTMGRLLYEMATVEGKEFYNNYSLMMMSAEMMVTMFGDDTFTRSGTAYRWHMGLEELAEAVNGLLGEEAVTVEQLKAEGFTEFSMDMLLRADGSADVTCKMNVDLGEAGAFRMDLSASGSNTKSVLDGEVVIEGLCGITLHMEETVTKTNESFETEPAAGETVVDLTGAIA